MTAHRIALAENSPCSMASARPASRARRGLTDEAAARDTRTHIPAPSRGGGAADGTASAVLRMALGREQYRRVVETASRRLARCSTTSTNLDGPIVWAPGVDGASYSACARRLYLRVRRICQSDMSAMTPSVHLYIRELQFCRGDS